MSSRRESCKHPSFCFASVRLVHMIIVWLTLTGINVVCVIASVGRPAMKAALSLAFSPCCMTTTRPCSHTTCQPSVLPHLLLRAASSTWNRTKSSIGTCLHQPQQHEMVSEPMSPVLPTTRRESGALCHFTSMLRFRLLCSQSLWLLAMFGRAFLEHHVMSSHWSWFNSPQ